MLRSKDGVMLKMVSFMTLIYPLLHEPTSLGDLQIDAVGLCQPSVFLLHFLDRIIYHYPFFLLHCHLVSRRCPRLQTTGTLLRVSPRAHRESNMASKQPRISTFEGLLKPL